MSPNTKLFTQTFPVDYPHAIIADGKGGNLLCFHDFTQAQFDLIGRRFMPRADDVYVVTYPRSGTTWMRQVIHLLRNQGEQGSTGIKQSIPYLEQPGDINLANLIYLQKQQGRRYLTTHQTLAMIPGKDQPDTRYIYVARNPKDCAVSYYHFGLSTKSFSYQGDWTQFCALFAQGLVPWGSQFEHVADWWQASRDQDNCQNDSPNRRSRQAVQGKILFVKYEEMQKNLAQVVTQVAQFLRLEINDAILTRVVEQGEFAAMRQNPKADMHEVPRHDKQALPHLRKGLVGDWRNYFTAEQNALYDELYQTHLAALGLTFDFGAG